MAELVLRQNTSLWRRSGNGANVPRIPNLDNDTLMSGPHLPRETQSNMKNIKERIHKICVDVE